MEVHNFPGSFYTQYRRTGKVVHFYRGMPSKKNGDCERDFYIVYYSLYHTKEDLARLSGANQALFWYDKDQDLKICFSMTPLKCFPWDQLMGNILPGMRLRIPDPLWSVTKIPQQILIYLALLDTPRLYGKIVAEANSRE